MQHALPRIASIHWPQMLAAGLFVATVATVVVDIVLWGGQRYRPPPVSYIQGSIIYFFEMAMALAYAAMGWLLAARVSRNPIGWLFLFIGLAMAAQMTATFTVQAGHEAFRPLEPAVAAGAWAGSTLHLPLTVVLLTFVFLLFPDGRPVSPRWANAGWAAVVGASLIVVSVGLAPEGLQWFPSVANPLAAPPLLRPLLPLLNIVGLVLLLGGVVAATASMVVRYRLSTDLQRVQLRWIAAAVLLLTAAGVPFMIARYALNVDYASGELLLATALLAGAFLPVAGAIAILRYHLFDIDVILNRALVYLPLTAILGGLYTGGVAFSQRVFVAITGESSDAAIVITTLVMASLFTTFRNSLQTFVDKRFKPATRKGEKLDEHAFHDPKVEFEELRSRVAALEAELLTTAPATPDQKAGG